MSSTGKTGKIGVELLKVEDLRVHYMTDTGLVKAVEGLELTVMEGENLGLVGETGAGKTTAALSIMRLIDTPPGIVPSGKITFAGTDLFARSEHEMRDVRGGVISMIFQDPMTSLNPVLTVEEQIAEMIRLHQKVSGGEAVRKAREMLSLVGILPERGRDFPHQFSGGMRQRVVIAIALSCNPKLLIADEPTTALDVTIQAQVLELMKALKVRFNTSMILITHDLGIVAEICDRVAIMYAGRIVERGSAQDLFTNPLHPYTRGLFDSIPDVYGNVSRLKTIGGMPPDPTTLPEGCCFSPRCGLALQTCFRDAPPMLEATPGHFASCPVTAGHKGAGR
jgi:peptide/nickel transport system ATP-binding protein